MSQQPWLFKTNAWKWNGSDPVVRSRRPSLDPVVTKGCVYYEAACMIKMDTKGLKIVLGVGFNVMYMQFGEEALRVISGKS